MRYSFRTTYDVERAFTALFSLASLIYFYRSSVLPNVYINYHPLPFLIPFFITYSLTTYLLTHINNIYP